MRCAHAHILAMYTYICAEQWSRSNGLSRTSGPRDIIGTIPCVSTIESADESDKVQEDASND